MPNSNNIMRIFTSPNIDAKTLASTTIYTTENGTRKFYVTGVMIESSAVSAISLAASISVGTNSTNFDNIIPITALTGLTAVNLSTMALSVVACVVVAANTAISVKVTTAATGTSQTLIVNLIGFYK